MGSYFSDDPSIDIALVSTESTGGIKGTLSTWLDSAPLFTIAREPGLSLEAQEMVRKFGSLKGKELHFGAARIVAARQAAPQQGCSCH